MINAPSYFEFLLFMLLVDIYNYFGVEVDGTIIGMFMNLRLIRKMLIGTLLLFDSKVLLSKVYITCWHFEKDSIDVKLFFHF